MKQNKMLLIVGVVVLLVAVAGGAFFLMNTGNSNDGGEEAGLEQNIRTLQPEDIGLELALSEDRREVSMTITKLEGIESVEYEASYDAEEEDPESGETAILSQGATSGEPIMVEEGQTEIQRDITLGTCSSGTCRYHNVVSDLKFVIKVNFENGEIGQVEAILPAPQEE